MRKCPSPTGFFKVDNLFGELLTEAQKTQARKNLNISSNNVLQWGNITGDIYNQEDLFEIVNLAKSQGIPILTQKMYDSLNVKPEKYIVIPDESDLNGELTTNTYTTTKNGNYLDILFSAIRTLQSEVARLKNTFYYGIQSYTGEHTTSSGVINSIEEEEKEPLWALDPEDLSLYDEIQINSDCQLIPNINYSVEDGFIKVMDISSFQIDTEDLEEANIVNYTIIDPKEDWSFDVVLTDGNNEKYIKFNELIPSVKCNILLLIRRKTFSEDTEDYTIGKNYIWCSVTNREGSVIKQGYLQGFSNKEILLNYRYWIKELKFKNLHLYRSNIYLKDQTFSNENDIPSSLPNIDNFTYGAAHITIRSVKTLKILEKIQDRLLNNELIWVESENTLYIKSNYKLISLSGGSINGGENMNSEEILELLKEQGIITSEGDLNSAKLNTISSIKFIHEDSGKSFNVYVDSEGVIQTQEINSQKEDTGNPENQLVERGAAAYYNCNMLQNAIYTTEKTGDLSKIVTNSLGESKYYILGDRIRVSQWYIPSSNQTKFNCTHDFIEITNCGSEDYPLDNANIGFVKIKKVKDEVTEEDKNVATIDSFRLKGVVPAGGTYLIRGKQRLDLISPIANVKVPTFDFELWLDNKQYDTQETDAIVLYHTNLNISVGDDKTTLIEKYTNDYFSYKVHPSLIDVVGLTSKTQEYFVDSTKYTWVEKSYTNYQNAIIKDQYLLDPAKQAFRSLTSSSETSNIRVQKVAPEVIPLNEEYISFPHSTQKRAVSAYSPKSSKEGKNICTDKTQLDYNKPNFVTCAFGINGNTTRCFNWISVGDYDEYIWIRKQDSPNWEYKFESYKEGDGGKQIANELPRRKEFSETVINSIYKRMSGNFPANNSPYVAHKVIIELEQINTLDGKQKYEYIVGKSNKDGTPDLNHCSDVYSFTLHNNDWTPVVFQTTDQQGFGWMEYQVWSAAANQVLAKIKETCTEESKCYPVFINTGDMTQNGTRINEWLDYYNGGLEIFKQYEQMCVVGNNDLCNAFGHQYLGTGDDAGKSNPYYFHLFYCYEVEDPEFEEKDNWQHPLIYNNIYIPSTYYFYLNNNGFLMVNSEITESACKNLWKAVSNTNTINLYTGFISNEDIYKQYCLKTTITSMIDKLSGKQIIAACHEMPFTVVNNNYLKTTEDYWMQLDRSLQLKNNNDPNSTKSLIGSHLNRLGASQIWDSDNNYWFSKLLQDKGIKLCIGGHKHTYACTYPIIEYTDTYKEFYESNAEIFNSNVSTTKRCIIKRTGNIVSGSELGYVDDDSDYFKFITDPDLTNGVTYFMLQATGYKLKSNKELPSRNQMFSKIIPETQWDGNSATADVSQEYPMYAVIAPSNSTFTIDLFRVSNIKKEKLENNKTKLTEFSEINYSTKSIESEKLLIASDGNFYKNYWLTSAQTNDMQRCYKDNEDFKNYTGTTIELENSEHTIVIE